MALRHPGLQELSLVEFTGNKMREDCNKKTCTKVEKPREARERNATNWYFEQNQHLRIDLTLFREVTIKDVFEINRESEGIGENR